MGVEVNNLSELDSELVEQEIELLTEALQEDAPQIDLRRGVLHDLLLYYGGILAAKNQVEQDRLRRSLSLQLISEDPTLADDDVVDQLASNYRVTRRPGSRAAGDIAVVVTEAADFTIGVGSRFVAAGSVFVTEAAYVGRIDPDAVVLETERPLRLRRDGAYELVIPVVAESVGTEYRLRAGASLVSEDPPASYVKTYAATDFVGGLDADDNAVLLSRFVYGMSAKTLCTRDNMSAMLRESFPEIVSDSIVGFGDEEMLRDRHSVFPVSLGGRIDWYVRPQPLYRRHLTTWEATLVDLSGIGSVWQLTFGRDDFPGLYYVQVQPGDSDQFLGEFEILLDSREADLTPIAGEHIPDIADGVEAEYTRFQSVVIRFRDTIKATGGLTVGDKADYNVVVYATEDIDAIQSLVSSRDVRHAAGDVLIKAPVPCFVSLSFTISIEAGQTPPDTGLIAAALADLVNGYGFSGRLPASVISDRVHNFLTGRASVGPIDMFARIRSPGGAWRSIRSEELLTIPDLPELMTSGRTAAFFLASDNVAISVVELQLPDA